MSLVTVTLSDGSIQTHFPSTENGLHTINFSFSAILNTKNFPLGKVYQQTELSFKWEQQKLRAGTWQTLE
jgi:hypothetical protein